MKLRSLLLKNVIWQGLGVLAAFALNLIMARRLGAEWNGTINYWVFEYSLMVLIGGLCLESAITYYAASGKMQKMALAWLALLFTLIATAILALLFRSGLLYPNQPGIWKAWALIFVSGYLLINNFTALWYAEGRVVVPNLIKAILQIILIPILLMVEGDHRSVYSHSFLHWYMLAYLVTGFLIAFAYFLSHSRTIPNWIFINKRDLLPLLGYAARALVTNIIFFLVCRVDYWFVARYCSTESLGNYTQASKWVQYFQLIPIFLASVLFPAAAGGILKSKTSDFNMLHRILMTGYIILLVAAGTMAYWIFPFMYGPTYAEMWKPFVLLIPGIVALSSMALTAAHFAGHNQMLRNLKGNLLALLIVAAGNFLFTHQYGIEAAAIVSSIAYSVNGIYLVYHYCSTTQSRPADLLWARLDEFKNRWKA